MSDFLLSSRIYPVGVTLSGCHYHHTMYDKDEQRRYVGDLRCKILKLFSGTLSYGVPSSGYFDDVKDLIEYPDIFLVHWSADYAKNKTTTEWNDTYKAQVEADATAVANNLKYLLDLGKTVIIIIFLEINYYFSDNITGPFGAPPDPNFPIDDFIETQCAAIKAVDSRFVTDVEIAISCTPQANAHANYPSWSEIQSYVTNYIGGTHCPSLDCVSISFYPFLDWENWKEVLEEDIATIVTWLRSACPNQDQIFFSEYGRDSSNFTEDERIEWVEFIAEQARKNNMPLNIVFQLVDFGDLGLVQSYTRLPIYYEVKKRWILPPYQNSSFYKRAQQRGEEINLLERIKTGEDEYKNPVFTEIGTTVKGFYSTQSRARQTIAGTVQESKAVFLLPLISAIDEERFTIIYDGLRWRVKAVDLKFTHIKVTCEREALP